MKGEAKDPGARARAHRGLAQAIAAAAAGVVIIAVLESTAAIAGSPAPSLVPQLDAEWMLLHCRYWLDQRAQDADAVGADVAERLWKVVFAGG